MTDHGDTPPKPRKRKRKVAPRSAAIVATATESEREEIRRILRPVIPTFCQKLQAGVEKGERNAMRIFPAVMGAVGASVEINVTMVACKELGVGSLDEARKLITSARSAQLVAEDREALFDALIDQAQRIGREFGKRVVILNEDDQVAA